MAMLDQLFAALQQGQTPWAAASSAAPTIDPAELERLAVAQAPQQGTPVRRDRLAPPATEPTAPPSTAARRPDFSSGHSEIGTVLQGLFGNGVIGGLGKAISANTAQSAAAQNANRTYEVLVQRGVEPEMAEMIVRNPNLMKDAIPRLFGGSSAKFGIIGEDEYGAKQYGWIDETARSVTPASGSAPEAPAVPEAAVGAQPDLTSAAPPVSQAPLGTQIPPPPPGVDPKEWRKIHTKRVAVQEADRDRKATAANVVVDDIDRAIKLVDEAIIPATGGAAYVTQYMPFTNAYDVANLVTTIKANAGFDRLQAMREASPTGGALGQVSNFENQLLQATIGNLEQSQSDEQFRRNLKRVKNVYLDIIHGPGNGPARESIDGETQGAARGSSGTGQRLRFNPETGAIE